MPALLGKIVKIDARKRLMVKITEKTWEFINDRSFEVGKRKFGTASGIKYPTYTLTNDMGEENYFCTVTLDDYDKRLMREKFEPLRGREVNIGFELSTFNFVPDDSEVPIKGVKLILFAIRPLFKGKKSLFEEYTQVDSDDEAAADECAAAAEARILSRMPGNPSTVTDFTAEEREVEEIIAPLIAERFNLPAVAGVPPPQPQLVRQNAVMASGMPDANPGRRRRRQVPPN